jgi:putative hydroxymethylpyrimidine transport system ATP-binding protein
MDRSIISSVVTLMSANTSVVSIDISGGYLRYHDSAEATIARLDMCIPAGQWTCILGRSGCGKSSLLRYLANLLEEKVDWVGELTTQPQCDIKGQIAYMAQQDLLMPWLSVLDNVMLSTQFGAAPSPTEQGHSQTEQTHLQLDKAHSLLQKVGLADKSNHLPQQLSGGMRQRVALARTLMQDKPIVLMDEPFSALDAVTRYRLQNLAYQLLQDKTVVLITHDPQEAIRLANRLYIMQGRPAFAESLAVPISVTPRSFDAECAELQQTIMDRLEQDYA